MTNDKKTISTIFEDRAVSGDFIDFLNDALVLNSSDEFYKSQKLITEKVGTGEKAMIWHTGKSSVFLLDERHALPIIETTQVPLVKSRMQYPSDLFEKAREGEIVLEMTKERSSSIYMIEKNLAYGAVDPLLAHERNVEQFLDRLESFMRSRNLTVHEMNDIMADLEEKYPSSQMNLDH